MGQREIIGFLRARRLAGDNRFYDAGEIALLLNGYGASSRATRRSVAVVLGWPEIETKTVRRAWYRPRRVYRYKRCFLL